MPNIITNDDFNRADTSIGTVTGPSIFNSPSTGAAYVDEGGTWQISGGTLINTNAALVSFIGHRLFRPISEKELNQTIQVIFTEGHTSNALYVLFREQSAGATDGLFVQIGATTATLGYHSAGGTANNGTVATYSGLVTGTNYIVTVTATTPSAGSTTVTFTIAKQSDGIVFGSGTLTETTSYADTHTAGTCALGIYRLNVGAMPIILRWTTEYTPLTNFNCNASSLATSSSGNGLVLTGTGTNWLTSTPTFTATGVAGVTITEQHILSDTQAVIYVSVGATTGTLTLTDPSQGSLNTCTLTVAAATGVTPNLGYIHAAGTTVPGQCKISIQPAFGGKGPYTYHAYRARTSTSTTAAATQVGDPVFDAATGLYTLTDTPPDNKVYCYRITATDSYSTPQTGQSSSAPCFAGYNPPAAARTLPANSVSAKVAVLGDSIEVITNGGGSVYSETIGYLTTPGNLASATGTNQSHSGAKAADFDSAGPGQYYASARTGATGISATIATMMIGTNDSVAAVTKSAYKTSLTNLAAGMLAVGATLMLHYPNWQTVDDNTKNDSIINYCDAIDELITAGTAMRGDRNSVVFFQGQRTTMFQDAFHPNQVGIDAYARFHADALLANLAPAVVSGGNSSLLSLGGTGGTGLPVVSGNIVSTLI